MKNKIVNRLLSLNGFLVLALAATFGVAACSSSSNNGGGSGGATGTGGAGTGGMVVDSGGSGGQTPDDGGLDTPAETGGNAPKDIHMNLINAPTPNGIEVTRPAPTADYNVCRQ